MKVFPLSEGSFSIDKTKEFIPFDEATDKLHERTKGSLLVEVQPFVVITGNDVLLLDAGLGFKTKEGRLQIHQNLIDNGINPSEVTKVLMTHLHKDHAGGVSYTDDNGTVKLTFPQAKYYIQQQELDYALSGAPGYITDELEILRNSPQVELLQGDGQLGENIRFEITGGHSKYHQVIWISEGDEVVFFGGDDAPQFQQMKKRYAAKYDFDGKKSMELRQQWWKQGTEEKWTFLFYHDVKRAVVKPSA